MKKILSIIISALLCMTMLVLSPAQVIASAEGKGKYISEVKVGMGETADEASKELLAEGYTILADDKGNYADLNEDAGSNSILKGGPNQKIVYLGYKTTDSASEAITDLAVMNMNGGFSYQAYDELMQNHMDTQIKPFVNRFIATLEEYRENLDKPQDSVNYKRADYYRTLLNKLTDDDTGGKPLGDLLAKKTKYEMGDEAYNALSDEEKKEHCDILTLLMQGNGQTVQLMETQLTKASDSSDNTWLDRFLKKDLDALTEEVKEENPGFTPSEINQELDKKYYDNAKKIRDKWNAFREILINYDNAVDIVDEIVEEDTEDRKEIKTSEKPTDEEIVEVGSAMYKDQTNLVKGGMALEDIVAHDYLEGTKYGKDTLLSFFETNVAEFSSEKKIRQLYPIVDALSGGQLAGLDFLSIKDMIIMALTDENGFNNVDLSNMQAASIYQDVNREVYEKGGVALTSKAMREKAAANEAKQSFELSTTGIVLWSCTGAAGLAAAGSAIGMTAKPSILRQHDKLQKAFNSLDAQMDDMQELKNTFDRGTSDWSEAHMKFRDLYNQRADVHSKLIDIEVAHRDELDKATEQFAKRSNICKYLTAGFTVAMAILAGLSIYTTITEMMEYYKVDFAPIPKYIVDEADITASRTVNGKKENYMTQNLTAYYKVVSCNRTDGGGSDIEKKNHEILKDRSDLNGDVGKQWLALYSVKYKDGLPILADSLKFKLGEGGAPEGYETGIHMFGDAAAQNLTDSTYKELCYNDPHDGTYVYFKRDAAPGQTAAGSLFSGGSLMIGAVIGLIVGGGLMWLLTFSARKRKERSEQ